METRNNNIQVFATPAELALAAAKFIIRLAEAAVNARGRFVISLSGGHTPEQLFTLLSTPRFRNQVPWQKTYIFWGDERCVPAGDERNNAHMAKSLLLDMIDIPQSHVYPVPVALAPAEAAVEYEREIKDFFKSEPPCFDLILLGLGSNGHTASLFPGSDVLYDHTRLVREAYVAGQEMYRITMTALLINQARNIVFLVAGSEKAEILSTVLTAGYQPDKYPAQLIHPVNGHLFWYADSKAAVLLPGLANG